jgi:glycerophosphoryl diester phosphodiesterase
MWTYPRVLAHRGGGTLAPENTIAALRCAVALGFRAVEFDVMAVRDGGLVLMHDPILGRTIRGEGSVANFTVNELSAMDAGSWHSLPFAGEPVPGFIAVADFCLAHGLWMNVEIKTVPGMDAHTGQQVAAVCKRLPAGSVLLSSFSLGALRAAQAAAPEVPRALLVQTIPDDWERQLHTLAAVALHVDARSLNAAQAKAVKRAGFGLLCYTVNQPEHARVLRCLGVDAICTDRPDLIGASFFENAD